MVCTLAGTSQTFTAYRSGAVGMTASVRLIARAKTLPSVDLIRDNGYAVSVRPVPERECQTPTYDVTAVAQDGERFVVHAQSVYHAT